MVMSARSAWLLLEGPPAARAAREEKVLTTERSMWLLLEGPAAARAAEAEARAAEAEARVAEERTGPRVPAPQVRQRA